MLGVIFDVFNKEIGNFSKSGVCSRLSLLTESMVSHISKELYSVGAQKIIFYTESETSDDDFCDLVEFQSVYNIQSLMGLLKNTDDETLIVAFCDTYFEIDNNKIKESMSYLSFADICDNQGNEACFLLKKSVLIESLEKIKDVRFISYEHLKTGESPKITGVKVLKKISSVSSYKKLINDILDKKTIITLPVVANGVYAEGSIPVGDFVIIPPVFFGEGVQIEAECVIGPHTVLSDNTLISKKSCIRNSVLLKDCFISSGCFCDNSFCFENVSVRRNSAVFGESVIGNNATIGEGVYLENGSLIRPFTRVGDYKNDVINFKYNEIDSTTGFCGYTPEKAALLGAALGTVFENKKIGILGNGEINSSILKLSVLSGLMSVGAVCCDFGLSFQSALQYYLNYCSLDYGVFIDGTDDGTMIIVMDKFGNSLSKDVFYSIKELLLKKEIERCSKEKCKPVNNIHGMWRMYINNLTKNIKNELNVFPVFNSPDVLIKKAIKSAVSKLKFKNVSNKIYFNINRNGTVCEACVNDNVFPKTKLLDFVSFYDETAGFKGNHIWRYDAVFLCFKVLETISNFQLDFISEIKNIPSFYLAEKVISTNKNLPCIASYLSETIPVAFKNDELIAEKGDLRLKIINNPDGNKLKILARSIKAEIAEEIALDAEKIIKHFI